VKKDVLRDVLNKGWIHPPKGSNIGSIWNGLETTPKYTNHNNF
jgi:hypothetical protein